MDGEQVETDLIDALLRDEELQASWHSFHTVRSVMRKESAVFLGADFTAKMADLIELEDVKKVDVIAVSQPEPEDAHNSVFMQKIKSVLCANDASCCCCWCMFSGSTWCSIFQ